ncbi:hypothetical protein [Spirosoma rhododendri]|uniref:YtxH domain-containing protein n=1 Tax=Spirosoma rhododendri TaxID=2728024 RepID=A0A7L5DQ37_9BACT|nr:hypothetical protein [Spirosoma rhododendri]QJD78628.1 hypothetical protein HH216_09460 [Spirosoma rhododendri]
MEITKQTAEKQMMAAKDAAAQKFESFKAEASQHLDTAATQLDELRDQLVAKAQEVGKDIDIDGLKASATQHFEEAKASTAQAITDLQAQAETAFSTAAEKADALSDAAEDKFDEVRAEAAVQLDAAQVKLDELKAEAARKIEEAKEKAKGMWSQLFGE